MKIYSKNKEAFTRCYPYIQFTEKNMEGKQFIIEKSKVNEKIIKVEKENEEFYLNSKYEAKVAAQIWADQFQNVTYRTKFIIIGLANGVYLRALKEKYPDNLIICVEAFEELEDKVLKNIDISDIAGEKVFLAIGEKRVQLFKEYIATFISYVDKDDLYCRIIPNYRKIDEQAIKQLEDIYYNQIEFLHVCRNTVIFDEKYRQNSVLKNFFVFPQKDALGQLLDKLKDYDFSHKVAIVVSAGPSLDKNIKLLKNLKNKMFLISVDAAAKSMIKIGVRPDIIVTIDPVKDETILQDEELLHTTMICSMYSHYKIIRQHKGALYFQTTEADFSKSIYKKYGHKMCSLPSGGSVANNAFSLAELLGFGTIVLIGQDLSYPNGKIHATSARYKYIKDTNEIDMSDKKYFEVEANDGGKVLTEANMDIYRRWFEERIRETKARVINATEGGAKIEGAEIKNLKEVIDEFTPKELNVDYEKLVKPDCGAFSKSQQKEIYDKYKNVIPNLKKWKQKLLNGILRYEKLRELNKKGENYTIEYKELVKENGILTQEFEHSKEAGLLKEWGNKEVYEALDTIISKTDSQYDETENVIKAGILTYETDIKNSDLLLKEWNKLLMEYKLIDGER